MKDWQWIAGFGVILVGMVAIAVVMACAQAYEWVGLPEGQFHLAEATLYLATAAKSNSTGAFFEVLNYIEEYGYAPPPQYLRDPNTLLNEERGQGPGYKYPHSFPGGWVDQRYLPEGVPGGWYKPKNNGYEQRIIEFLEKRKSKK